MLAPGDALVKKREYGVQVRWVALSDQTGLSLNMALGGAHTSLQRT
jgi:hypothetical protein